MFTILSAAFAFSGTAVRIIPEPLPKVSPAPSGGFAAATAPVRSKAAPSGMTLRLIHIEPNASVQTIWSTQLAYWPSATVVSDDGHVATVGSWYALGTHEAVTLFDDAGRVLANYPVEKFATPEEKASLPKFSINFTPTLIKEAHFESGENAFEAKLANQPRSQALIRATRDSTSERSVLVVRMTSGRTVYFDPTDGKQLRP